MADNELVRGGLGIEPQKRSLYERMVRDESEKPTGLGRWLVDLYKETDYFNIESRVEELKEKVNGTRKNVVEGVWNKVFGDKEVGYKDIVGGLRSGFSALTAEMGDGRNEMIMFREVAYAVKNLIEGIGKITDGRNYLSSDLSSETWVEFTKNMLALGLVLRTRIGREKENNLGGYVFDLGMLNSLINPGQRDDSLGGSSWKDEKIESSARIVADGWAAGVLARSMVEESVGDNGVADQWGEMTPLIMKRLELWKLADVSSTAGGYTIDRLVDDNVQRALGKFVPQIEKTERLMSGELADPSAEMRQQIDQVLGEVVSNLKENKTLQNSLRDRLRILDRKAVELTDQKEKLEEVKGALDEVSRRAEAAAAAKRERDLIWGEMKAENSDELTKVLGLKRDNFSSREDYRLLADNWDLLGKVYGVDLSKLSGNLRTMTALITAAGGAGFDNLKDVLESELGKIVNGIGDEEINEGRKKINSLNEKIENVEMDPTLNSRAKLVLSEVESKLGK